MPYGSGPGKPGAGRRGPAGGTNRSVRAGKRVIFVTPYEVAAKEEAEKASKNGLRPEIKKEKDDTGTTVFVVYVFEGGFG